MFILCVNMFLHVYFTTFFFFGHHPNVNYLLGKKFLQYIIGVQMQSGCWQVDELLRENGSESLGPHS